MMAKNIDARSLPNKVDQVDEPRGIDMWGSKKDLTNSQWMVERTNNTMNNAYHTWGVLNNEELDLHP